MSRIFKDYVAGKSPKAIAHQLNKEGFDGPSGRGWGASTLYGNRERGTGILNNELYIGQLVWNRLRYIKDPDTGKRVSRLNPEDQWIRKDVPELRIIDQELWEQVKAKQGLYSKKDRPLNATRRPRNLFSFLLKCGCCGGGFSKMSQTHYGCSTARNKGTCDNRLGMHQEVLEHSILSSLQAHLMNPELCKVFCEEYTRHLNELRKQHNTTLARHKAELARLIKNKDRIIKAVVEGYNTPDMKDELNQNAARRAELEKILEGAEDSPVRIHPHMANRYHKEVRALVDSLNTPEHRQEAASLLRSLIEKIVLTPKADKSSLQVDLYGDLAGILSVATKPTEKLEHQEDLIHQVALVANGQWATGGLVGNSGCGGRI